DGQTLGISRSRRIGNETVALEPFGERLLRRAALERSEPGERIDLASLPEVVEARLFVSAEPVFRDDPLRARRRGRPIALGRTPARERDEKHGRRRDGLGEHHWFCPVISACTPGTRARR